MSEEKENIPRIKYISIEKIIKGECVLHDEQLETEKLRRDILLVATLKPALRKQGKIYYWLTGENVQHGLAGFGSTPYEAMLNFNKAFNEGMKTKREKRKEKCEG